LIKENLDTKINLLLKELQKTTGVSDEKIEEFKKIMDLTDFSQEK
tara:strand:+ start:150 stop:284 length:135 start_codon:yes stop_codon:yes gene_type:complete